MAGLLVLTAAWNAYARGFLSIVFGSFPNNPSLALNSLLLGFEGVGATVGGHTLPASLTQLGLPAYPGCALAVVPLAGLTMHFQLGNLSNSSYLRLQPPVPLPNDPLLIGAQLIGQAVAYDQPTSAPGLLIATPAVEINIGDPTPPLATQVDQLGSATATSGTVRPGHALTFRLQ